MQGEDERERAHQVGSDAEQHASLAIGFPHEAQLPLLEIAEAAMDQPARARARAGAEIRLLHEHGPQAPHRGITGHAGACDAATDDQQIHRAGAENVERRPS
jgi:hypothetical protein